jgi:hypothetical protein
VNCFSISHHQCITSVNRKKREGLLVTLRKDHFKREDNPEDSAKRSESKTKKNRSSSKAKMSSSSREGKGREGNAASNATLSRWLRSGSNPVGIDILDCHMFATTMVSATSDETVAERFNNLRSSLGSEMAGASPERARCIGCCLDFTLGTPLKDGPLFKAEVMEDKWDIYLFKGHVYFCRSWTGELIFRASVELLEKSMAITAIETNSSEEDDIAIRQVGFLVWSHLVGRLSLHPLPKRFEADVQSLTIYSFSQYGRRGWYGTMEDTLKLSPEQQKGVENLPRLGE